LEEPDLTEPSTNPQPILSQPKICGKLLNVIFGEVGLLDVLAILIREKGIQLKIGFPLILPAIIFEQE